MAPTRRSFPNRKSDAMDHWLDSQGLYRKHTARDGSCLFRAVAEQIFNTQCFHVEVRRQCVQYMLERKNYYQGVNIMAFVSLFYFRFLEGVVCWSICGALGKLFGNMLTLINKEGYIPGNAK